MICSRPSALITLSISVLTYLFPAGQELPEQLIEMTTVLKQFRFDEENVELLIRESEKLLGDIRRNQKKTLEFNKRLDKDSKFRVDYRREPSFTLNWNTTVGVFVVLGVAVVVYQVKQKGIDANVMNSLSSVKSYITSWF